MLQYQFEIILCNNFDHIFHVDAHSSEILYYNAIMNNIYHIIILHYLDAMRKCCYQH